MNMRVRDTTRGVFGAFLAWPVFILGLIAAGIGISETHVVSTVFALIVAAVAGMYLLARRSRRWDVADEAAGELAVGR